MSLDYYEILWVSRTSSLEEIKKAYRKKAMEYHPDRWWDENKFKQINEAYSVLSDENKRREYDTYWRVWWNSFWQWWFWWVDFDLWDIFEQFFWWQKSYSRRKRSNDIYGEDLEYNLEIDLKTSILWWKKIIKYTKMVVCDDCNWIWWKWQKTCNECYWIWYVKYRQRTVFWTIEHTSTCQVCGWVWEIISDVCNKCKGGKRVKKEVELEIEIPAWIDEWMVVKINSEWNEWIKSRSWDLYVRFSIKNEEKNLKRKWVNLFFDLDIDVVEAVLWTSKELNIPIIWKRTITIEPWTQFGSIIKIPKDWVKYVDRDKKWDLFINLNIKIPKRLSEQERKKYEEIAKEKKLRVFNKKWILWKIFW